MKPYIFFLFFLFSGNAIGQPTQAEMDAMQKKLEKLRDSVLNDPKLKKIISTQGTDPLDMQRATVSANGQKLSDKNFENPKLPKKDTAALRRIPSKNFSPAEISIYLSGIHSKLEKMLPPEVVRSANAIAQKLQNNPLKMENTALSAWNKGAWEESLLLITDAATRSADEILLTNAGAILDMAGLSEISVPVLRTVVRNNPNNAIAFNNLGQAYAALGLQDSALHYCGGSIKLSPQHPEANNTAGVIELVRGNKEKAQAYFENSIRGSFNTAAYKGLKSLLKDKCRIAHLIKPKVKLPEYFNQFKFKLPRQCANVQQAVIRKEEQKNFRQSLSDAIGFYQKLGKEAGQRMRQKSPEQRNAVLMNKAMKGERILRPFQALGVIMEAETILAYNDDFNALQHFNTAYKKQYAALEIEYKKAYDSLQRKYTRDDDEHECCGEGDISCCNDGELFCRESNTLKNKFLPRFAQLNEEWQSRNLVLKKTHLDNFLYWAYFAAIDRDDFTVRFYVHVVNYLKTLQRLDVIKILEPCHVPEDDEEEEEKKDTSTVTVRDCPVAFSIRFWIGKLDGDCEKISFKAGDGIVFRYERNFILRQQTISLGVGKDIDQYEIKALGLEGGIDFEASFAAYISFDLQGNPTDGGLHAKLKGKAGVGFESGQKLKFKDGISLQAGISSGLTFEPGPLKPLWEKLRPQAEQPINPRVRIYQ